MNSVIEGNGRAKRKGEVSSAYICVNAFLLLLFFFCLFCTVALENIEKDLVRSCLILRREEEEKTSAFTALRPRVRTLAFDISRVGPHAQFISTLWLLPGSDDLLRRWVPLLSRKLLSVLGKEAFMVAVKG